MAWAPVGEIMTGIDDGCPMIVVSICRSAGWPAVTDEAEFVERRRLSRMVTRTAPAMMAPYDEVGSRLARCWAMATVSNQGLAMAVLRTNRLLRVSAPRRGPQSAAPGAKRRPAPSDRSFGSLRLRRCSAVFAVDLVGEVFGLRGQVNLVVVFVGDEFLRLVGRHLDAVFDGIFDRVGIVADEALRLVKMPMMLLVAVDVATLSP